MQFTQRSGPLLACVTQLNLYGLQGLLQGVHMVLARFELGGQSLALFAHPINFAIGTFLDVTRVALLFAARLLGLCTALLQ